MSSAVQPRTFVYKTVDGLDIHLDVYAPKVEPQTPRPVVLFFHGGFLIFGSRDSLFPSWFMKDVLSKGSVFVSADYRLLPEVDGFDVLQDAQDAVAWIRTSLNLKLSELGIESVDPENLVISGASAGIIPSSLTN
ncbi:Carboxylesterase 1 [Neolecta irregularis DAH-3]|uniref:Carboxylesterase 1 n=1 Tax=Neolecta irregularis (strain DAH-3) TaxID=1198029 RepID=A0A1U7LJ19_NEOID|nr:Carboxylesterase 1 [Neolecta irregularis DAH-3]|eukprot:OLL22647.1 Carboxylesterase 1 [Neolecta irregularis DAH-3]